MNAPARLTASPFQLLRQAAGDRRALAGKLSRLRRTAKLWRNDAEIRRRLQQLQHMGYAPTVPSRLQLAFGAMDMLRFVIVPAARDYYQSKGINFHFHQVLRFLDDPTALIDPTGLLSEREAITGHVLQVTHLNPIYDLQLLAMWETGLADFEQEIKDLLAGIHPRTATIGAVIEDPAYHARLLGYVQRFRADPLTPALVREDQTLRTDPHFANAEKTFATLPGYLAWCLSLPADVPGLLRHRATCKRFPVEFALPTWAVPSALQS
jgi:hypothetical protein